MKQTPSRFGISTTKAGSRRVSLDKDNMNMEMEYSMSMQRPPSSTACLVSAFTRAPTTCKRTSPMPSPLDSLFAAQEIIEARDRVEASSHAAAVARAKSSAAKAAAASAVAAAADAAAARAAATAAVTVAAADLAASSMDSKSLVAWAGPSFTSHARIATPSRETVSFSHLEHHSSTVVVPTRVGELDLQVKALLGDYAMRRAQLLGESTGRPATIDKKVKKEPRAHGLKWRAPRGRMAREITGGT